MRLINRKEFISMPENTLYFSNEYPNSLCIKGRSIIHGEGLTNDFFTTELLDVSYILDPSKDFYLDLYNGGRDGGFDHHELFYVFNDKDVELLVNRLLECKGK